MGLLAALKELVGPLFEKAMVLRISVALARSEVVHSEVLPKTPCTVFHRIRMVWHCGSIERPFQGPRRYSTWLGGVFGCGVSQAWGCFFRLWGGFGTLGFGVRVSRAQELKLWGLGV